MKENTRLYAIDSHQPQNLTSKSTTVQHTPKYIPFIEVNQAKSHKSQGQYDIQHRVGEPQVAMSNTLHENSHQNGPYLNTQLNLINQSSPLVFSS